MMLEKYPWLQVDTIRALVLATIPLVVAVCALFGMDEVQVAQFLETWSGKLLAIFVLAMNLWALYARTFKPTPPVTETAVQRTAQLVAKQETQRANGQGGFVRPLLLALMLGVGVVVLTAMTGCASMGVEQPRNLEDRIAYAYGTHTAVQKAAASALTNGALKKEDAQQVLELADDSREMLDASRQLYRLGQAVEAGSKLQLANETLLAIRKYLNARGVQ